MGFLDWLRDTWSGITHNTTVLTGLDAPKTIEELDAYWNSLSDTDRALPGMQQHYESRKRNINIFQIISDDPVKQLTSAALDQWLEVIKKYENLSPEQARDNLKTLTADVMKISGSVTAAEVILTKNPWFDGEVIAGMSRRTLSWLGFGAVISAIAHDPVKIGILRPYQDSLEQTFRNRRPDDYALFQAYRTRELSPIKIEDLSKLTEAEMKRVEDDNDKIYFEQISRWGYSEAFAQSLSRSATRTLNFSQLVTLARAGIYDKGLAIYSLWGDGLDHVVMPAALTAIETLRDREMYAGFRSMIEPSYIEGDIPEEDLVAYWDLAGVPKKVQTWVLPRLKKRREAYTLKQKTGSAVKERDLTVSQITQAYQAGVIKRVDAQNTIMSLGYSIEEVTILLNLAETRIKAGGTAALKRLPLSDYEKAYKNKLINLDAVLQRMQGEYAQYDIELERKLLEVGKA